MKKEFLCENGYIAKAFRDIYEILSRLERKLDNVDKPDISSKTLCITETRRDAYIKMLEEEGYITGSRCKRTVEGEDHVIANKARITLKGLQYLVENKQMLRCFNEDRKVINQGLVNPKNVQNP